MRLRRQESVRENQVVSVLTGTHLGLLGEIGGKTCGLQNELPVVSSFTLIPFDQFSIAKRSRCSGAVIHSRLPIFINAVFSLPLSFLLFVVAF